MTYPFRFAREVLTQHLPREVRGRKPQLPIFFFRNVSNSFSTSIRVSAALR